MRNFITGASYLFRGFGWWRVHPGLMFLGLVPAIVVATGWIVALVLLVMHLDGLVQLVTPFMTDWPEWLATGVRFALAGAIVVGAISLFISTFTAVTITIGEPIYERIWQSVEISLTGSRAPEAGFWSSAKTGLTLFGLGLVTALITFAVGLIPVVGSVAAGITGALVQGNVLGRELCSRSIQPRWDAARRVDGATVVLSASARRQRWGFGVITQLVMLIPLAAIVVMPAAVAGSTMLSHRMMAADEVSRRSSSLGGSAARHPIEPRHER